MALKLPFKTSIELAVHPPFNFDATFHKPDHFPSTDTAWEPGKRWQTMHWQGRPLGLCFSDLSTAGVPRVGVTAWSGEVLSSEFLTGLERELDYRYNLSLDLASFNARFAGDERLAPILARWRGSAQ